MLDNISPKTLFEFRDALKNLVNELYKQEGLYPQTLGTYLNELGEILFLENNNDENRIIRFMAPIADYLANEELRYSLQEEFEDSIELE